MKCAPLGNHYPNVPEVLSAFYEKWPRPYKTPPARPSNWPTSTRGYIGETAVNAADLCPRLTIQNQQHVQS
jgi:hypothetical protein